MRHLRWGITALGAAVVALVACTPPNLPAPLPALSTESIPPPPATSGTVTIGVDTGISGFNPYVQSQYSPAAAAITALVLPSVFAPDSIGIADQPTELVDSAAVTSTSPFTVTYRLNRNAAWSDGTPIAAEDFAYLWQQMISTPGVVDPGGYQLITAVNSADAGKTVEVVFAARFADWRSLFSPLLPARVLKDEPAGFAAALQGGIPVAGAVYRMESYDPVIGQVRLVRNDKYWGTQTAISTAVFREGAPADLLGGLARGDLQAVYLQPDAATAGELSGSTELTVATAPLPVSTGLDFNLGARHPTNEQALRTAIAYAVHGDAVRNSLAGGNQTSSLQVTSQLTLPAEPSAPEQIPNGYTTDPSRAAALLSTAGFRRDGLYYRRDDQVLTVVLGYPIGDTRMEAAARLIQQQLGNAGILVDLVQLSPADAQQVLTDDSAADLVLRTVRRGPSDLAAAVTATGCAEELRAGAAQSSAGTTRSETTSSSATVTSGTAATAPVPTPGLPAGCDEDVITTTRQLLAGMDRLGTLDAELWDAMTALPLAQPTATLALGPSLDSVTIGGDPTRTVWTGLLETLPGWPASA